MGTILGLIGSMFEMLKGSNPFSPFTIRNELDRIGMSLTNPAPQREELPTSHVSMVRNMPANNRLGVQVGADIGKAMVSLADWGNRVPGVGDMPRMVDYLSGDSMAMGAEVAINARYNPASLGVRPITNFDLLNSAMAMTAVTLEATAITRAAMAGRVSIGAAETVVTGETLATATGKSVHANLAAARRASGDFDLVNAPFVDASGTAIQLPKRVNLLTGDPVPNASLVTARPDAARFSNRLILDDKPLGRPLSKDRQEFIRFIEAYRSSQGHLPNTIAVQRYNPVTGQPVVTELYTPFDFLPKGPK